MVLALQGEYNRVIMVMVMVTSACSQRLQGAVG